MNDYVEVEVSEAEVTIAGISAEPPAVTLVFVGRDSDSIRRDFVQQVPVSEPGLLRRVLSELRAGDRALVTVTNEWREDGCDTYLSDFKEVPDVKQEPTAKNGTINFTRDDMTQIAVPPVQDLEAKVRR